MCQAVFCVTPRERASSHELTPFFALTIIQKAGSHLSNFKGESSKIVPTFTVNCFLQLLQLLTKRLPENVPTLSEPQCGQITLPPGHRISIKKLWQFVKSEKKRMASI